MALIALLWAHWIGDFILQSRQIANSKHKSVSALGIHCITYSSSMTISGLVIGMACTKVMVLWLAFFASHYIIDYVTSRANHFFYERDRMNEFWVFIGADQLAHTLVILYVVKFIMFN